MTQTTVPSVRPHVGRLDSATQFRLAQLPIGRAIRERAALTPDDVVVREQQFGIYAEHTWAQYSHDVETFACGLLRLGIRPGDAVAIMGDPSYLWMVADAAIISVGAISFGIYTTCSTEEIAHQLNTAGAVAMIAENQEYVDKLKALGVPKNSGRALYTPARVVEPVPSLVKGDGPALQHRHGRLHLVLHLGHEQLLVAHPGRSRDRGATQPGPSARSARS